jgi:hypothetical protein
MAGPSWHHSATTDSTVASYELATWLDVAIAMTHASQQTSEASTTEFIARLEATRKTATVESDSSSKPNG